MSLRNQSWVSNGNGSEWVSSAGYHVGTCTTYPPNSHQAFRVTPPGEALPILITRDIGEAIDAANLHLFHSGGTPNVVAEGIMRDAQHRVFDITRPFVAEDAEEAVQDAL